MIQLVDVSKTYQMKKGPAVQALDHVNLTFGEKGLVFILGKSGAGKSTLLNVVGGLDRIDSGDIVIMGKSTKDFTQAEFDSYRNTYVGFIFQEYNILPDFSIGQNIALALQLQGQKGTNEEVDAILDQVDLHGLRERKPNELSGGQKQRVAIARALIKKPQIIMADEPTGALDSKTGQDIFNTLKKLAQDHLVICVSHDREFAENFGDRVIEMKDGKVISDITKSYVDTEKVALGVEVLSPRLLSFEKGHVLTEEDVKLLNSYLQQADQEMLVSSDAAINTSVKTAAKIDISGKKGTFSETTPDKVGAKEYKTSEFQSKKSRLPFARSLKIALGSLKSKPFRLVVTSILVIASLTLFGVAATLAGYDTGRAFKSTYTAYNVQAVGLAKEKRNWGGGDYAYWNYDTMSMAEAKAIAKDTQLPFKIYPGGSQLQGVTRDMYGERTYFAYMAPYEGNSVDLYTSVAFSGATYLESSESTLTSDYGANLESGRFPTSSTEVLISDYRYQAFQSYGYRYYNTPTTQVSLSKSDCASEASFLAKKPQIGLMKRLDDGTYSIVDYPIVGIFKSNVDLSAYSSLKGVKDYSSSEQYQLYNNLSNLAYHNTTGSFIGIAGFQKGIGKLSDYDFTETSSVFDACYTPFTANSDSIDHLYTFLARYHCFDYNSANDLSVSYTFAVSDTPDPAKIDPKHSISSAYDAFLMYNSIVASMKNVFFWTGFATACFASLLLATFIASSIAYQKRKIGILRAIGARGMDVYGIFYNESLLITLTGAIVAEILTIVIDNVITQSLIGAAHFEFPLFQFTIWIFLLVLGLAVLTATISSFLPCLFISKKKPIDSINDK